MKTFQASVWREESLYIAQCLDVDVVSQGGSPDEALENLREAVQLFFETASEQEIQERSRQGIQVSPFEVAVG